MKLDFAAISDVGRVRKDNQDSGYAGAHLLAVCDGVGGAARGDIASAAFKTALKKAHGLVLVANPYRDCVSRAEVTLDVVQRRRPDLLPDKVVLSMTHIDNMPPAIDLAAINNYFQSRATHPMVTLPYDPEIRRGSAIRWQRISEASRTAALELAGPLADLFPTAVDTTSPAHRVRTSYAS